MKRALAILAAAVMTVGLSLPCRAGWILDGQPEAAESSASEAAPAALEVDGNTLKLQNGRLGVVDWIPDNLMSLWYEVTLGQAVANQGFVDGPGYIFDDQGGILADLSVGENWRNPGYASNRPESSGGVGCPARPNVLALPFTTLPNLSEFGFAGWVYDAFGPADNHAFIEGWAPGVGGVYLQQHGNGEAQFGMYDVGPGHNQWASGTPIIPPNTWTHVAMTFSNATVFAYINGILVGTNRNANFSAAPASPMIYSIGQTVGSWGWNSTVARLDEWIGWSRCPSSNEIYQIATTNKYITGSVTDGAFFHYHMDEGTGSTAYDSSPSANHATLDAGAIWTNGTVVLAGVSADMTLVSTNTLLSFTASNALPTVVTDTAGLTTNLLRVGIYDVQNNVTNWGGDLTTFSSAQATQYLYRASAISGMTGTTNVSAIIWLSSNSSAVVKGVAVPCGP